jgi:hypothetical protein
MLPADGDASLAARTAPDRHVIRADGEAARFTGGAALVN